MKTLKIGPISNLTLFLLLGLGSGAGTHAYAQELRDLFRHVKASVVTVRTTEREITPQSNLAGYTAQFFSNSWASRS
jgi:hypothetical protein